jgi:NAD(P)H dehydrogenase (quinone)
MMMNAPTTLVVGATGKTGGAVVLEMLRQGRQVRALVRREDERTRRLVEMGAQIAVADLFDRSAMTAALESMQYAYWCAPFDPRAYTAAEIFADAARAAKIEHIVGLSQWLASPEHPSLATRNAYATDRLFESLAPEIGYTIVNPGFFADNYLRLIGFAAQLGVLPSLTGNSRNAPPSNEDIARVAVAILADPAANAGKSYRPTGPTLLSTADMAAVLSKVLRRKVRRAEMPMWLFLKAARMQGVPAFELSGFRHYVIDHKQGAFERGAPTNVVERLTGRPPEDFGTIAQRYANLPEARRTVMSATRAWMDFMRTPMMPGYDLKRLERQFGQLPKTPRFAMADPDWAASHGATGNGRMPFAAREATA